MPEASGALGWPLVIVGSFLLAGFVAHIVGSRAHVPRVTLLLLLGLLAGPAALDVVPPTVAGWFPGVAQLALSMVGFGLGEQFLGKRLRESGRQVLTIAAVETVAAALLTGIALLAVGTPTPVALLLAGIAPATAPAATVDVVHESKARGPVTQTLLAVAAVDDAFGIILFSVLLAAAQMLMGGSGGESLLHGLWELVGSCLLGAVVGAPMAWLTGRARPGVLTLIETLGCVFITSGLSEVLGLSYLLSSIAMGAVVANFASHHQRPFHAIAGVSQPLLVVFFLLAGFDLDIGSLPSLGLYGGTYVLSRSIGKLVGSHLGARWCDAPHTVRRYLGWCLLPQAGVALGLALLAAQRLGRGGFDILGLLVGSTFLFEMIGPIAARTALRRAGETSQL